MRITPIPITTVLAQVEMLREHWQEVARNKGVMVLKPDAAAYDALERAGLLIVLGAFDGDTLVGYSVSIFNPAHLHYADLACVHNDAIFVAPEYRGASRAGLSLIRETERIAKERGARLVLWHAKEGTTLAALMPRLGYGVQDIVFSREV
jgi:GNAT superfamily N-acetyltransferase